MPETLTTNVSWDGISFMIPEHWEVQRLGKDYIFIDDQEDPQLEIKWNRVNSRADLVTYFKRFVKKSEKLLGIQIDKIETPEAFRKTIKGFNFFFFDWAKAGEIGSGMFIFCHICKKITMIRFFSKQLFSKNSTACSIIDTFADHPINDHAHWNCFGLELTTPSSFKLIDFSFKPGRFTLNFQDKTITISCLSWGPADFLLHDKSLAQFAQSEVPRLGQIHEVMDTSPFKIYEWRYRTERFKNANYLPFMKKLALYSLFRIFHDTSKNRIFGVLIESPKPIERHIIEKIRFNEQKKGSIKRPGA